jgi:hypothetical protein
VVKLTIALRKGMLVSPMCKSYVITREAVSVTKYLDRSLLKWILVSTGMGLAAFYFSASLSSLAHASDDRQIVHPLTAEFTRDMYKSNGDLFATNSRLYARFSDGSVVFRVDQLYPRNKPVVAEIINIPSGERMFLDSATESVTTLKRSVQEARRMVASLSSEGCPDNVDISRLRDGGEILGIRTVYYLDKVTPGVIDEEWLAPDLNCLILKEVQTSETHGGARNVEMATLIALGEPSESLRTVPSYYAERDPEAVEQRHKVMTGGDPFWGPQLLQKMKREYRIGN